MVNSILANEMFKQAYPRVIRRAFVLTIAAHLLLLLFSPSTSTRPPEPPRPAVMILEETADEISIIPDVPSEPPVAPPEVAHVSEGISEPPVVEPSDLKVEPPPPGVWSSGGGASSDTGFVLIDRLPEARNLIQPKYPRLAREAGMEGTVKVVVVVNAEGKVESARLLWSDVTLSMERAAIEAALRSTFDPARQGTRAVRAQMVIPFQFRLR